MNTSKTRRTKKITVLDAINDAKEGTKSVWLAGDGEISGEETALNEYDDSLCKKEVVKVWYEPETCLCIVYR